MRKLAGCLAALLCLSAVPSSAQQVRMEFNNGSVTLHAENAPIRSILAEWARRGGTRIINAERVGGGPVTLELMGVPELQAIEILLRGVAGYMVGRREVTVTGPSLSNPSMFDRIHIVPTSTAGAAGGQRAAAAPPIAPRVPTPRPQVAQPDDIDTDLLDEPVAEPDASQAGAARRPGTLTPGFTPARAVPGVVQGGVVPATEDSDDPQPASRTPTNPFGAISGTARPGVIVPPAPPAGSGRTTETQIR